MRRPCIGGSTNATHGFTLSGIALPYYRRVAQANPVKFAQFVRSTWGASATCYVDTPATCAQNESQLHELNNWGLQQLAAWMLRLQVVTSLRPLGVTPELIPQIARNTVLLNSGYVILDKQGVIDILTEALDYQVEL